MPSRMRFKHRKLRRREKAEELAALRAARTDLEQLAILDERPGESYKERERIKERIEQTKKRKNIKNAGESEHGSTNRQLDEKNREARKGKSKIKKAS